MPHYVMVGEGVHPAAAIRLTRGRKSLPKPRWMDGQLLGFEVPVPIVVELDPDYPGTPKPLYGTHPIPVMSDEMADALTAAGVDNLELFPAVLLDSVAGVEYRNYKAFNIVGKVSAADMERSTRMGVGTSRMIAVDFDALVIDEASARGLLLFRLAENLGAIVVDQTVRDEIERRGIAGVFFYPSGEWSG